MNKLLDVLMNNRQRALWMVLYILAISEFFHLFYRSFQWHYVDPWVFIAAFTAVVSWIMAVFYNQPMIVNIRRRSSFTCNILVSAYIALSGILLWIIDIGWNGCFFIGQSDMSCMKTVFAVWDYFPITNPSIEMILLSFHGFGGRNEIVGVFSTLLVGLGLVMTLSAASDDQKTFVQKLLPSFVIISCMEGGFYGLFTITQSIDSWPGVVVCIFVAAIALMLDWRQVADSK